MLNSLAPELKTSEPGKLDLRKNCPNCKLLFIWDGPHPGMWTGIVFSSNVDATLKPSPSGRHPVASTTRSTFNIPAVPTGFPKGATLSHHNILNNGCFVAETMKFTHKDRLILPVPAAITAISLVWCWATWVSFPRRHHHLSEPGF